MQDQVKTDTGYNYGGTSYKNEERTNEQTGQKYSVAIPISSVVSQPTQPQFQTPAPQAPVNYNAMTSDTATPYDAIVENRNLGQNQEATDLSNLMNTLSGKSAFESQQNEATGLNAANQAAIQKAAEISALGKQAAAAQQENISQGRQLGSVGSFVAGQGAEIERNRAIKALSLGAELDAINGNIAVAQSKVKQAVDAEYADKEQLLANKLKMFDINDKITQNLSAAKKEALANARYKVEKEEKRLSEEKATRLDTENLITEAIPNAPANVIANAKKLAESGASKLAVAQALGVYGGDVLKRMTYESQLLTDKAQRANLYSQIAERNQKAIKENQLANFQAPPIVNAQTGKIDPKSVVASIIKSTGGKLKGGQAALDVLSSVQGLADRNLQGTFEGVGFGGGAVPERYKSQNAISNRQDIEAIGLKVQQWASGASLTEQQTEMVNKFTPQLGDSDNAVKKKINGLVNFMMGQVSSDLAGQGINYSPETIDMFSGIQSVDNKTFLGGIPTAPKDTTKLFDNKTFFDK